ncbi:MFS transporter [Bifidobacterium psychraerophilum]|uniref:MFS transporter n=1 Tax=Bifidobacterium psychraerophilum TaxID=218140 RepID=UPI0031107D52
MSAAIEGNALSRPRIGRGYYPALIAASTTMWSIILGPVLSTIPSQVNAIAPGNKVYGLALVTGIAGVVGIITNPLIGHLSDITSTRLGRRIPWLLAGLAVILPVSVVIGDARTLGGLALWWTLLQIGANMLMAPTSATIPDLVPEHRRGMASACLGIAAAVAPVLGTGVQTLLASPRSVYLTLGALIVIAQLFFILTIRGDRAHPPLQQTRKEGRPHHDLLPRSKDFWLVCAHRILFGLGQNMALAYLFFYLQDVIHYAEYHPGQSTDDGVLALTAVYAPCVIIAAVVSGSLTDRTHRFKWCLVAATVIFAAGAVLGAVTGSWIGVVALAVLTGIGYGAYASTSMAMAVHLLPDDNRRARDLSLINVADLSAIALGPIIAAMGIAVSGYSAVFIASGILVIISGIAITRIRGAH